MDHATRIRLALPLLERSQYLSERQNHSTAEPLHCRLEAEHRPGTRFVEEKRDNFIFEEVHPAFPDQNGFHLPCDLKHALHDVRSELQGRGEVLEGQRHCERITKEATT